MKITLSLVILALSLYNPVLGQAQTVWKLASGYPEETFHTQNLKQFANDVSKATSGRLQIDVYANNTMVRLADIPSKVETGEIAAGETIMSNLAKDFSVAGADSVPFVVNSYGDARRLWKFQRPMIDKALAHKGMITLYATPWPSSGLYSVRPIRVVNDLKGMTMRTFNDVTRRMAEKLGTRPVEVPQADLNKAMATGRIETMITSGVSSQPWVAMKYFYDIRAFYPKNIVFVNQAAFKALDAKTRDSLMMASVDAEMRGWKMSEEIDAARKVELVVHGMRLEPVDFNFRSELRRIGERFSVDWIRTVGQDANSIFIPYYANSGH